MADHVPAATVTVVGSLNTDLQLTVDRHPRTGETVMAGDLVRRFGGKGANQAIAAAVAGASTRMIGAVGDDIAGRDYLDRLAGFGVASAGIRTVSGVTTGTAVICLDADHDNMIMVSPGANHHLGLDDVTTALADVGPGDVVVVQLEVPSTVVEHAIRTATDRGARVVANLAPYGDLDAELLARCDPVVVNESEHAALQGAGLHCPSLLVTLGTRGSRWGKVAVPALAVEAVDTTGAGDAYVGTLAAALAGGAEPGDAMRTASTAAAACVEREGAQPEPSR